jgi:ABC-type phosphate transport system substrate-binding protein
MKRIVYLTLLYVSAALLLSIGVSMDSSQAADGPQITIAYSSNMLGYMEPCG